MTFAFDLDGTLNRHPKEFVQIMRALRGHHHLVVVLTAAESTETREHRISMMEAVGITEDDWDKVVLVVEDGGNNKAQWCKENNVAMLFDDTPSNHEALKRISPATGRLQVV